MDPVTPQNGTETPATGTPAPTPEPPKPTPPATPSAASESKAGDRPADDEKLGEAGLKALQRERDARAAAEKALAELRQEIEDSKKSAEQKAAEALENAKKAAAEAAARALRYEVAAEKGLPLALAARLTGATKEELAADADALRALIPATPPAPKPDPSAGASGDPKPKNLNEAIASHYSGAAR